MWEECGVLKVQVHPFSERNLPTAFPSAFEGIPRSLQAPTKLVPLSECMFFTGPRIARNLLNAFMKLEESKDSMTSICMALVLRQVKRTAHLLLSA